MNAQLCADVRHNKRDALDLAGKAPIGIKALAMGIAPHELIIDPAQAGGLLGKFDAAVYRAPGAAPEGVEIKGARSYRGSCSFQFSRLRPDTPFQHLVFVAREADPQDWTDVRELNRLFWLGYVSRTAFDRAVAAKPAMAAKPGLAAKPGAAGGGAELKASLTIGRPRRSWLGDCVLPRAQQGVLGCARARGAAAGVRCACALPGCKACVCLPACVDRCSAASA